MTAGLSWGASRGRPSRAIALALVAFLCALVVTSAVLSLLAHRLGLVVAIVIFVPLAVVGAVIARHQPRNPIGWMMLGSAALGLLDNDALLYSVVDYGRFHARLPLGPAAVVYGNSAGTYSILLGMLVIGLFPDGRGLSRP